MTDSPPAIDGTRWRETLLETVLRLGVALGTVVCVPSVYLALVSGLLVVAIGDLLALGVGVGLLLGRRLGYRRRALGFSAVLFGLGAMLLVTVGPVAQIYLFGFSLLVTLLLGLRAGLLAALLNALTLGGLGMAGWAAPAFAPPAWLGAGGGWPVITLNFAFVNIVLVAGVGYVVAALEAGVRREAAARASLARSEAWLRMVTRVGRMGGWTVTLADGALAWSDVATSPAAPAPTIVPRAEEVLAVFAAGERARVRAAVDACAADGQPFDLELPMAGADRQVIRVMGEALRDADGRIVAVQGAFQDVSEKRATEARLRQQAELLEKAQDAIVVHALDWRVRYLNRRAEELCGWERAATLGADLRRLAAGAAAADLEAAGAATLAHGAWMGELEHRRADGTSVRLEARWTLLRDAAGAPEAILSINTDITERTRLEQQFRRAQRLESIGTLAGGIAHDLNNILTPILMALHGLQADERDARRRADLGVIEACARRAGTMVQQILAFARGEEGRRVELAAANVVDEVARLLRETLPRNITVHVEGGAELWPVRGDATQLHQVLMNLCVNGRDAMPSGGTLTLATENAVLDEEAARLSGAAGPGRYVVLRVRDTGTGMSDEVRERVFEPFFTTKAVGQGTGLGLSTSHGIVRGHGGFMTIYSEAGRGTDVRVYLPAAAAEAPAEVEPPPPAPPPPAEGGGVLVVDDEAPIRAMVERTLTRHGYRVRLAADGAEAIGVLARHRADIDVVLTDMSMPVVDGAALLAAVRAMAPGLPVICSSGLGTARVGDAGQPDAEYVLPKPYTADALLAALQAVLGKRAA